MSPPFFDWLNSHEDELIQAGEVQPGTIQKRYASMKAALVDLVTKQEPQLEGAQAKHWMTASGQACRLIS